MNKKINILISSIAVIIIFIGFVEIKPLSIENLEIVDYNIETVCFPFECEQEDFDKMCDLKILNQNNITIGIWKNSGTDLELDYIEQKNKKLIIYFKENGIHTDSGNILIKANIELKNNVTNDYQVIVFHEIKESGRIKRMGNICQSVFSGI